MATCFRLPLSALMIALLVVSLFAGAGAAPVRANDAGTAVADAQKGVSAAAKALSEARKAAAAAQDAVEASQTTLSGINAKLDEARRDKRRASQQTERAGQVALRASEDAEDADAKAQYARAMVMRIARNAYAGAVATSDLMMFTEFFTDGSASLGDISQQLLTAERIQERLVHEAEVTARAADRIRGMSDAAAQDHSIALDRENEAKAVATGLKSEAKATQTRIRIEKRQTKAATKLFTKAEKGYAKAQEKFKTAFLAACSSGGASAANTAPPPSSGNKAQEVWDTLLASGFTQEAAAGILGNLQQESSVDPTVTQNGGPGMGLAQWSRGGRWDSGPRSMLAFAGTRGLDPWKAETQTQFMLYEMSGDWFDLEKFRQMTDIAEATVYFHDVFERSADSGSFVNTIRVGYAQMWYARLSGAEIDSKDSGPAPEILSCPND